jgi:signal transduction histidine kinase
LPADDDGHEQLCRELGRVRDELGSQRRLNAMTVHDLSSPAQVILGLSEVLLEHQVLDPMVRRQLEQLHRSAMTMTALITDLSHGFSLEDTERLELERLDLAELATSVVDRTRMLADAKNMKLVLFAAEHGCWVEGDSVRLERAMVNLLGNAIKFSPPGSSIAVSLDRGRHFARFSVHDEGPGITEEGKARIFEVFQREEETAHLPASASGSSSPSRSRRATAAR